MKPEDVCVVMDTRAHTHTHTAGNKSQLCSVTHLHELPLRDPHHVGELRIEGKRETQTQTRKQERAWLSTEASKGQTQGRGITM